MLVVNFMIDLNFYEIFETSNYYLYAVCFFLNEQTEIKSII